MQCAEAVLTACMKSHSMHEYHSMHETQLKESLLCGFDDSGIDVALLELVAAPQLLNMYVDASEDNHRTVLLQHNLECHT